jgi:hypothetical protein
MWLVVGVPKGVGRCEGKFDQEPNVEWRKGTEAQLLIAY